MVLFLLYLVLLIYFLFFAESYGRGYEERSYSYNLVPFLEMKRFWTYRKQLGFLAVFTNLAGNVIGFVPFGAILPILYRNARNMFKITFLAFECSLLVECTQLIFRVGSFDVDDLILNTLGGFLGYLIYLICDKTRRKIYE